MLNIYNTKIFILDSRTMEDFSHEIASKKNRLTRPAIISCMAPFFSSLYPIDITAIYDLGKINHGGGRISQPRRGTDGGGRISIFVRNEQC